MSKFVLRRNRIAATFLALGALAAGGFALHSLSSPDGSPAAICRYNCM